MLALVVAPYVHAQVSPAEKSFPQSKSAVEKALKGLQSSLSGHLPTLDGFAQTGEHSLDRYQRAFFQTTVQVSSAPSGGSVVRVSARVTAWFNDPSGARSGYQVLPSNGRLEADLLDQLTEQLGQGVPVSPVKPSGALATKPIESTPNSTLPSAPSPPTPSFSVDQSLAAQERAGLKITGKAASDPNSALQAEADSLSEVLKSQGHPKNLVAVKKSGTPVVATPSLTAKPQFLASVHDEFEMLDFNRDWVHVRISGLSRGWIWRNSVEMPEGIADTDVPTASTQATAADLFRVSRDETAPFPGDWAPLRGKNVKIISVQKLDDAAKAGGPKEKLEYTKFLLDKNYAELVKTQELAGMVVIFDSADGGMIAATVPTLQQWRAGTLTDSALWHKCFFDPPETFDSTGSSASQ
jgi:hypothetical protein